ncbi:hypothetical protein C408_4481 [Vibrio diabolicus E0666]|uniref:Uncharacterized protein n=1 Tax=Vibrio antiquarius (strain Ex25) TaxID=150340 RepID=A0ACA6QIV4_VIBAE|nr:hypothetical protein VEA_002165 [Vibrio antiquarius]EMD77094.1 hypothetical protein C408_4481 [Vibrio diabolicus E0666]
MDSWVSFILGLVEARTYIKRTSKQTTKVEVYFKKAKFVRICSKRI